MVLIIMNANFGNVKNVIKYIKNQLMEIKLDIILDQKKIIFVKNGFVEIVKNGYYQI